MHESQDNLLILNVSNQILNFYRIDLRFSELRLEDIFAHKNNKTVAETLAHHRYQSLRPLIVNRYPAVMGTPLGSFLLGLKRSGDLTYKRFLNPYGDSIFCRFVVRSDNLTQGKGVYCFCTGDDIVYVGRSHDPIQKRINQGYGTIHPKNCFLDGQATNCHVNALIAVQPLAISCFVCPMTEDRRIDECERLLIRELKPNWNIAMKLGGSQVAREPI